MRSSRTGRESEGKGWGRVVRGSLSEQVTLAQVSEGSERGSEGNVQGRSSLGEEQQVQRLGRGKAHRMLEE